MLAHFYAASILIKMLEHAETFHSNKGRKLAIVIFIPTLPLKSFKCRQSVSVAENTKVFVTNP